MTSGKAGSKRASSIFKEIDLSLIDHPEELSRMEIDLDRIRELADSIKERGLLQPILVHPKGDRYGIIAGDRRFMAHEMIGLKKIMCRIREISGTEIIVERAIENLQREDLTPFEEAFIYQGLRDKHNMNSEQISKVVGKSAGVVERRLSILKMPDSFQKALHQRLVSISVAEELWSCPDSAKREYFMTMAVEHGITKDVARMWVSEYKKTQRTNPASSGGGGGVPLPYDDLPIFRACDVCREPVEYGKVKELRVCPVCGEAINSALKKQN